MAHEHDPEEKVTEEELPEAEIVDSNEELDSETAGEDEGTVVVDDLEALRTELEETKAKEAEYLEGWQRARAELSNARKRFEREQMNAYTNAKAGLFSHLLPIVDDFDRAFDTLPEELSEEEWLDGIKLVSHKFKRLLEQEQVEQIEATGQEFDPLFHEALTHEPSETVPDGHVIGELQRGYRVGDRVLRPSMVRVSSGPAPSGESSGQDAVAKNEAVDEKGTPAADD